MKRFRFPLRSVAVVRAHREMQAREALAMAIQDCSRAEERWSSASARVSALAGAIGASRARPRPARDEAASLQGFRRECLVEAEGQKQALASRAVVAQRRDAYFEARRQMEIVRRLEERARASHRAAMLHAEQVELEEIARRRMPLGGRA